ncbi:MAG: HEAT repeat domain-containing protein [Planctomycetes bacterium]|nr:HEAT repeat domain-containing protein [Planctomycetota bacterium]
MTTSMLSILNRRNEIRRRDFDHRRCRLPKSGFLKLVLLACGAWISLTTAQADELPPLPQEGVPQLAPPAEGILPAFELPPELPGEEPEPPIERPTAQFTTPSGLPDVRETIDPQTGYILEHGIENESLQRKLTELLLHRNPQVREKAAAKLSGVGNLPAAARASVSRLLLDPNPPVRHAALSALGQQQPPPKEAVSHLVTAMNDPDDDIATQAMMLLGKMGADGGAAVPGLISMISDAERGRVAMEALGEIGPAARWVVPQLLEMFQQEKELDPTLITTLGKLGASDALQHEFLKRLKKDPHDVDLLGQLSLIEPTTDGVIDALVTASNSPNEEIREAALMGLAEARPTNERIVAALGDKLKSKIQSNRLNAADALGEIEPKLPTAIPLLVAALNDKDQEVRTSVLQSLSAMPLSPESRLRIYAPLGSQRHMGLENFGWKDNAEATAKGLPALKSIIKDRKEAETVRAAAVHLAWQCEDAPHGEAKALSLELMADPTTPQSVVVQSAVGLAGVGVQSPRVTEVLLAALQRAPRGEVRLNVALSLAKVGQSAGMDDLIETITQPVVQAEAMVTADDDGEESLRHRAIWAAGQLPPAQAARAVPVLCKIVKDPDSEFFDAATTALGQIVQSSPSEASRVVPMLANMLQNATSQTRPQVLIALGKLPPTAVASLTPEIAKQLANEDPGIGSLTVSTLHAMGPSAAKSVPALLKKLHESGDGDDRSQVLQALAAIGGDAELVAPEVVRYLDDENLTDAALQVLNNLKRGTKAGVPGLRRTLGRPWGSQRRAAAMALGKIGPDAAEATADLVKLSRDDPDAEVRSAAAAAVLAIQPEKVK